MNANLTDLTLVVDRSGSMDAIRSDAEGGINALLKAQAQEPGDVLLTLVQFDTVYEFLHHGVPLKDVPPYKLEPRGGTALLDAVGRAILETGARLSAMPEADRPGLVLFVVMTDGQENSSREFDKARVREMIEHQQTHYNWHFTFLGANQDAFAEAGGMGMAASGTANVDVLKVAQAYAATSSKVSRMRKAAILSAPVSNEFTEEERARMQ